MTLLSAQVKLRHRLDDIGEIALGRQIAHRQGEALRAAVVERVGKVPMVRAVDAGIAPREVRLALCQRVAVDQNLLVAAVARSADMDDKLAAGNEFSPIRIRTVRHRHADVLRLDTPLHLRNQPGAQAARVAPAPHRRSGFRPSGRHGWPVRAATNPARPRASSCHAAMRSHPRAQYRDCAGVPACGLRPEARCGPSSPLSVRVCSPLRRR